METIELKIINKVKILHDEVDTLINPFQNIVETYNIQNLKETLFNLREINKRIIKKLNNNELLFKDEKEMFMNMKKNVINERKYYSDLLKKSFEELDCGNDTINRLLAHKILINNMNYMHYLNSRLSNARNNYMLYA